MILKSKYNFREGKLGKAFAKSKTNFVEDLVKRSITFTLLSIPGVGVTQFLRNFAMNHKYYFAFMETLSLTSYSKGNFLKLMLKELEEESMSDNDQDLFIQCQKRLANLAEKEDRIVLIFNRFNRLGKKVDYDFFSNLRILRNINPEKIVMIFTSNQPFDVLNPKVVVGPNVNFLFHLEYFGTYQKPDLRALMPIYAPHYKFRSEEEIDRAVKISGGHINLLSLLLNNERLDPISDRYVAIQLKDIFDALTYRQKGVLKSIASGKSISVDVDSLIKIGLVKIKSKGDFRVFTPLLEDYLKYNRQGNLSANEAKLYSLLKKNLGKIVTKDEIFRIIWKDNPDLGSDWALNALIYRLKKNPAFEKTGYIIESHKKIGYSLIEEMR